MGLKKRAVAARAGFENAKARGSRVGRPPSEDRGQMVRLRKQGVTYREIARFLGCSTSTIQRALRDQKDAE